MDQEIVPAVSVPEAEPATVPAKKKVKDLDSQEKKDYQNATQAKCRAKKQAQSFVYNSKLVPTKSEAMELLAQRVSNEHVRSVVYELGLEAAAKNNLIPNKFFWANGLTQALASK